MTVAVALVAVAQVAAEVVVPVELVAVALVAAEAVVLVELVAAAALVLYPSPAAGILPALTAAVSRPGGSSIRTRQSWVHQYTCLLYTSPSPRDS